MARIVPKWRCVTLDATGTLFRPRGSIGARYLRAWERVSGAELAPEARAAAERGVDTVFPDAFHRLSTSQPNFGAAPGTVGAQTAAPWWRELVLDILNSSAVLPAPVPRELEEQLTSELYAEFATPDAWRVYDDVRPALDRLKAQGVVLGVISNFDERLPALMRGLELDHYFQVVTSSFEHGRPKPAASIFETTFEQLGAGGDLNECLHVGDHRVKDYDGARAAGVHARLLIRHPERGVPQDVDQKDVICTLASLVLDTK